MLPLQTAVLQAALDRTVPGEKFLNMAGFREFVSPSVDDASLHEMLRELVNEGVLQLAPCAAGDAKYCATQEFVASMAGA